LPLNLPSRYCLTDKTQKLTQNNIVSYQDAKSGQMGGMI
jgi:hypothetical protein